MEGAMKLVVLLSLIALVSAGDRLDFSVLKDYYTEGEVDNQMCERNLNEKDCAACCNDYLMEPTWDPTINHDVLLWLGPFGHYPTTINGLCSCKATNPIATMDLRCVGRPYDDLCPKCCKHRESFVIERNPANFDIFECHCTGNVVEPKEPEPEKKKHHLHFFNKN